MKHTHTEVKPTDPTLVHWINTCHTHNQFQRPLFQVTLG